MLPPPLIPALLNNKWILSVWWRSATSSRNRSTCVRSATSTMCVVTRSPCGNPAASHSPFVSARPVGETSHIATLQASERRGSDGPYLDRPRKAREVHMTEFAGRTAVVTGGGSGMGRELVRQLVGPDAGRAVSRRGCRPAPDRQDPLVVQQRRYQRRRQHGYQQPRRMGAHVQHLLGRRL